MNIGIDLGGSHIGIGIVEDGNIIAKRETSIDEQHKKNIMQFIEDNIILGTLELLESQKLKPDINPIIEKIGIAVPGAVQNDEIIKCVNLEIENYNIADKIKKQLKEKYNPQYTTIKLQNDAKCAAIAEKKYGCLNKYDNAIFLTLGTGIGGAVIHNGKLLQVGNLPGFEFGHMTIDINSNILCNCGKKGCFEQYSSMRVFKENLKKKLGLGENITGKQLYDILKFSKAIKKNENEIREVINEFIKNLAIGISNLINIFEPEAIGIGGSFSYFQEFILEDLKHYLKTQNLLFNPRNDIIIKSALLGNDAGIIGATLI